VRDWGIMKGKIKVERELDNESEYLIRRGVS